MNRRIPTPLIAMAASMAVIAAVLLMVGLAPTAGTVAAKPQLAEQTNGCTSPVTTTASPNVVRICDPSTVQVETLPSCPVCPGGMKAVFVQRGEVTDAAWQRNEATEALQELEELFPDGRLQVALVEYQKGRVRTVVPLTDKTSSIRGGLNRPRAVGNPPDANGDAREAARQALKQLEPPRDQPETMPTCKLVLFFAQDSPTPG